MATVRHVLLMYLLEDDLAQSAKAAKFKEPGIRFEDGQAVWVALDQYRKSKGGDFADALIVNKAKLIAGKSGDTFRGSYTFDQAAQKLSGAKEPK